MAKNAFYGQIEIVDSITKEVIRKAEVDLPGLEEGNSLLLKIGRDCTAGGQVTLKSSDNFQNCGVTLWGTVSCTEEDFWSGEVHEAVANHLAKMALVFEEKLEEGWLPGDRKQFREGFSEEDFS